jgi:F0F1-type ATP synthase membrane subunit a
MFLGLLLPLIEIFRQVIRPLTLIIRLRTNLSAGHIIIFMFSFFSSFSFTLVLLITPLLVVLLVLELAISLLQAYIFSSLSFMYLEESLNL